MYLRVMTFGLAKQVFRMLWSKNLPWRGYFHSFRRPCETVETNLHVGEAGVEMEREVPRLFPQFTIILEHCVEIHNQMPVPNRGFKIMQFPYMVFGT